MDKRSKVWGEEIVYIDEPEYVMKMLKIKKGMHTSLHYHPVKKETMYVLKGSVIFRVGSVVYLKGKQGTITIRPGTKHQIRGRTDCIIIEVSTQPKDDSVRMKI